MNLWDALMGESVDPPAMPKGSAILCTCGRRIGVETTEGDVWRAEYHHTAAGAAHIVIQNVLQDAEVLCEMASLGELDDFPEIERTLMTFYDLAGPSDSGDLSRLAAVLPRLVVPAQQFQRQALELESPLPLRNAGGDAAVPAGCRKCRHVYDLREVVGWGVRNKRGALLVGDCDPAGITRQFHRAPASHLRERVEMYRRLNVVLSLQHNARR